MVMKVVSANTSIQYSKFNSVQITTFHLKNNSLDKNKTGKIK